VFYFAPHTVESSSSGSFSPVIRKSSIVASRVIVERLFFSVPKVFISIRGVRVTQNANLETIKSCAGSIVNHLRRLDSRPGQEEKHIDPT